MFVLLVFGTLAYVLFVSNKLFRPYCGGEYIAEFIVEPFETPAGCEKKYESFGIFRDVAAAAAAAAAAVIVLLVFVVPFIMATDNGLGESERAGETGPIEFM